MRFHRSHLQVCSSHCRLNWHQNLPGSIRLEVDPYDLVSDAISFYKGPKFQPCQPIRVAFIGQPAIDSGGVKRQFYTDLFLQLVTTNQFKLFQGPNNRLLFYYDQTALNCGLFKLLGKMVAHSICQGCPGFPYLAPAMYYYLATGDINQASAYASIADIPNQEELNYVEKVHTKLLLYSHLSLYMYYCHILCCSGSLFIY